MKKCPFCAEEIQDEAIVCRYCGLDLETQKDRADSSKDNVIFIIGKWLKRQYNDMPHLKGLIDGLSIGEKYKGEGCADGLAGIIAGPIIISSLTAWLLSLFGLSFEQSMKISMISIYSLIGVIVLGAIVEAIWRDIFG